ncbi:unnamed protein product [Staurois parvus]|uniref:Uncharacterized protein n=1 Tax=Staurois parvus TaxID=386267 RepID=A0ABN9GF68_9NEOB|nr:unnamed protein product [Staurois parvus]
MGPCTASSCCCQARNLSWAPVPPPHAAARSRVCHGSLYGLPLLLSPSPHSAMCHFQVSSHCWWVPFCHKVLADYGPPIAAARPEICHGPLYRLLMLLPGPECVMGPCTASSCCCQVQSVSWVPVRPPIAAVSIATLCHVPLSGLLTLLVGSILS